jgi:hypothetical protein
MGGGFLINFRRKKETFIGNLSDTEDDVIDIDLTGSEYSYFAI